MPLADTAALLAQAGRGPGMRCVDLGCGGGEVTLEMARLAAPDGVVAGVDMDKGAQPGRSGGRGAVA